MRSLVAGLAIFVAFLTGTAALAAFVAHQTVLDPDNAGRALDAALSDDQLADQVLESIVPGFSGLPRSLTTAVRRAALDPSVHEAARNVTFDPRTGEISLKPIQSEVLAQVSRFGLGGAATNQGEVVITVPAAELARYNDARARTSRVATLGALATAVLWAVALLVSPRRPRTLLAIGASTLVGAVVVGGLAWLAPGAIDAATSSLTGQVAAVMIAAARPEILTLLAPFAVAGAAVAVLGLVAGAATRG